MNLENIKTIEQMAKEAIENKVFDDECDELEYYWGYMSGARQALKRVKDFINGCSGINANEGMIGGISVSQGILIGQINEFIDALEGNTDGE